MGQDSFLHGMVVANERQNMFYPLTRNYGINPIRILACETTQLPTIGIFKSIHRSLSHEYPLVTGLGKAMTSKQRIRNFLFGTRRYTCSTVTWNVHFQRFKAEQIKPEVEPHHASSGFAEKGILYSNG